MADLHGMRISTMAHAVRRTLGLGMVGLMGLAGQQALAQEAPGTPVTAAEADTCLLYTSPSPRDS